MLTSNKRNRPLVAGGEEYKPDVRFLLKKFREKLTHRFRIRFLQDSFEARLVEIIAIAQQQVASVDRIKVFEDGFGGREFVGSVSLELFGDAPVHQPCGELRQQHHHHQHGNEHLRLESQPDLRYARQVWGESNL